MSAGARESHKLDHSEPLLKVRGLAKEYTEHHPFARSRRIVVAFDEVNFSIRRGTTLALVGESGAGKSTLARCLALLEKPTRGEIWFEGVNLLALSEQEHVPVCRKIQLIHQDPASALNPGMTAAEIVAEPLVIQRLGTKDEQRARAIELMRRVGLSADSAGKRPLEFSGGQRQRLAIARALTLEPSILILDEACSGLDLQTQELILDLLASLQAALGMSFIYVSHDLRAVSDFADEVAVMYQGRIVEHRVSTELFEDPKDPYTRELLAAMPSMESICADRLIGASR
jgi:ABC-type glutathione transport system ATPase component